MGKIFSLFADSALVSEGDTSLWRFAGMKSFSYTKLRGDSFEASSSEDTLSNETEQTTNYRSVSYRIARLILGTCLPLLLSLILILWISQMILQGWDAPDYESQPLTCGNTTAEARERGCSFDLLSYTWQPDECIEKETLEEFREWAWRPERRFGSFPFFTNRSGEEWIANEETLSERIGMKTYTPQEEHLGHCIFWLRRVARLKQGKIRHNSDGEDTHAVHCTKELAERLEGENPLDVNELHAILIVGMKSC
jgi:hypothetical protein